LNNYGPERILVDEKTEPHDELDDLPMTWEEAAHTIETEAVNRQVTENVYSIWHTLKKPFFLLSVVIAVLCAAVIFLAVSVRVLSGERNTEFDQDACYDAYTSNSSEAIARVRAAATKVDNAGWYALIRSASGEEIGDDEVATIEELTREAEAALEVDAQRLVDRDEWVAAGRPLPCPVTHGTED
jgi:hypothetical protein